MKNLAGNKNCDDFITSELKKAGLEPMPTVKDDGEVAYSFYGEVGGFKLTRAWTYWVADADVDYGLSLEVATELHEAEYRGEGYPEKYGDCVRVTGHCGCPPPKDWLNEKGKISSYHIDTQEGLNRFVQVVKGGDGVLAMYEACKAITKKVEAQESVLYRDFQKIKTAVKLYEKQK